MPSCTMKIFSGDTAERNEVVAENVKIGDKLTLAISIDYQGSYSQILLSDCYSFSFLW